MISNDLKKKLKIAFGDPKKADAFIAKVEANGDLSKKERRELEIAMADKKAAAEILADIPAQEANDNSDIADAQADVDAAQMDVDAAQADLDSYTPAEAAEAILDLTADITLTSVAAGAARNGNTFTLEVNAAAANTDDEVLVAFTGTAAAIICTVTPNDGTNNSLTPVDLTSAELVELINTGAVVGKNINLSDMSSLRALQTAAGGDATALADAGEGDSEMASFANGADEAPDSLANLEQALEDAEDVLAAAQAVLDAAEDAASEHKISSRSESVMEIALADKEAAEELKAAIEE